MEIEILPFFRTHVLSHNLFLVETQIFYHHGCGCVFWSVIVLCLSYF